MSIRESRLCDFKVGGDLCRSPSDVTCPFCGKDGCDTHFGSATIMTVIACHTGDMVEGRPATFALGAGVRRPICRECYKVLPLTMRDGNAGILDTLAASFDDKIVPELHAYFAAQTMAKKP